MNKNIISWIAQLSVAGILASTLGHKLSGADFTVELFGELGMGLFGVRLIGFLELMACVLLLIPSSIIWGALLSWGLMSGAIMAHVTKLGFEGERGEIAVMAITAWLLSLLIMYLRKDQVSFIANMFGRKTDGDHS